MQLLGVPDQAEKDEIVKAVMQLKGSEVEEGYTMDAVKSREVASYYYGLFFLISDFSMKLQQRDLIMASYFVK